MKTLGLALGALALLVMGTVSTASAGHALFLDFDGLEPLGAEFEYEGWAITPSGPVSTGRFRIDGSGNAIPRAFRVEQAVANVATAVVITIEPKDDPDPGPAATKVLGAMLSGGTADLTTSFPAALGTDFGMADGAFFLQTPTSASVADDYDQGLWFLEMTEAGPMPSLNLPALPEGWAYEGWVAGPDGPISTGTFTDPAAPDSDMGGPAAGPDGAPPFPGQDFIDPALVLVGMTAVISVEPVPDDSPAPFALKPLVREIMPMGPGVLQPMMNNAANTAITGTATLTNDGVALHIGAVDGLDPLGAGWMYEGWVITPDGPVTTGRFTVLDNGRLERRSFVIQRDVARNAQMFVLTIEPSAGDDPAPSDTHILGGTFNNFQTTITVDHPTALGHSFMGAEGQFFLQTPTSPMVAEDFDQGIWFIEMTEGGPTPGLNLPALPAGWVYEGWVVGPSGAMSTGRFTDPAGPDSDMGGPAAGPAGAPPYPGQDYVDPALSLPGLAAVISIEPEPDDSPAPFTLKPLVTPSIGMTMAGMPQFMNNNAAATNPSAKVFLTAYK